MPKVKRNHTSSRSLICLICRFKIFKNGRILTDKMKLTEIIRGQYNLLSHYDPSDTTFPNAICSTCCRGVYSSAGNEGGRLPLLRACAYTHTLSRIRLLLPTLEHVLMHLHVIFAKQQGSVLTLPHVILVYVQHV